MTRTSFPSANAQSLTTPDRSLDSPSLPSGEKPTSVMVGPSPGMPARVRSSSPLATSQSMIPLLQKERARLPSAEKCTELTYSPCTPVKVRTGLPAAASQSRRIDWSAPTSTCLPSGANATQFTDFVRSLSVRTSWPLATSQIRIVPSGQYPAEATNLPDGEKLAERTQPL